MPRALAFGLALIVLAVAILAVLGVLDVVSFDAVRSAGGRVIGVLVIVTAAVIAIAVLLRPRAKPGP